MDMKEVFKDYKKYLMEMFGAAVLTLVVGGVAIFTHDLIATAISMGVIIVALGYILGPISGCHLNPALSLAAAMRKKISWKDFGFYALAQLIGALLGGLAIFLVAICMYGTTGITATMFFGANNYAPGAGGSLGLGILATMLIVLVLSFVFVFIALAAAKDEDKKNLSNIPAGIALAVIVFLGIAVGIGAVNPVQSFGIGVFSGTGALAEVWPFLVIPFGGAALAALTAKFFFDKKKDKQPKVAKQPKAEKTEKETEEPKAE